MEPSEEPVLKVNRTRTALVLGGNVPSAVPPDFLIPRPQGSLPLQVSTVKTLASILIPPLCPSALSSKFRVVVLLHGLTGTFRLCHLLVNWKDATYYMHFDLLFFS